MEPYMSAKVDLPCAWTAEDLAQDKSWLRNFTAAEIAELDAALKHSKSKGLAEQEVTADDFPLPTLAGTLRQCLKDLETGTGVLLMRGFPVADYSYEDIRRMYWGMGRHMGALECQNTKGEYMQEITDLGFDYNTDQHRGSMTSAKLRPHCDPTDVVGLLCVRPAVEGGASTIRSSTAIFNEIVENHPEYLPVLYRGFPYDLDGKAPSGDPMEVTHFVPVFSWCEGLVSCRFNQKAIEDGAKKIGRPLSSLEADAVNYVGNLAIDPKFEFAMDFKPGDIQLLNNYVTLHSREHYVDGDTADTKRLLLRLWVNHVSARPLDFRFANKMLMGARRGVIPKVESYEMPEKLAS